MPRKIGSATAPRKEERLNLDQLWNTTDPKIKKTLFRFLDEERSRGGKTNPDERAIIRLGLEYRHVLPARQQVLLVRDARALGLVTVSYTHLTLPTT